MPNETGNTILLLLLVVIILLLLIFGEATNWLTSFDGSDKYVGITPELPTLAHVYNTLVIANISSIFYQRLCTLVFMSIRNETTIKVELKLCMTALVGVFEQI